MSAPMTRSWKIVFSVFLAAIAALASWVIYHETRTPQNETEVLKRMIELGREGRYDKAVQVVQRWMDDSRRDVTRDEILYEQIAFVYIGKARKRPGTRDESVHLAELNLEKALDLFEKEKHTDLAIELFEIGGAYELLGDNSDKEKCQLYEKARELFVRQLPLIKGDSYTAYGHTTPLEPLRGEVRKHLNAVSDKSSKDGCQVH